MNKVFCRLIACAPLSICVKKNKIWKQVNAHELGYELDGDEEEITNNCKWNSNWAFTKPREERHLYFVNIGSYDKNAFTLNNMGRAQMMATGQCIKELHLHFHRIYVSRARQAWESWRDLRERSGITDRAIPTDSLIEHLPPTCDARCKRKNMRAISHYEAAFRRYCVGFPEAGTTVRNELYVSHINIMRYMILRLLQLPYESFLRLKMHHGSITKLTIKRNGNVQLQYLNSTHTLKGKQLTSE